MAISHNEAIVSNDSFAFRSSASMYGHKLTDACIVANDCKAVLALELEILRYVANNGTRMDVAVVANSRSRVNNSIRINNCSIKCY